MGTTVITFDITSSYENWVNAYDESLLKEKEFGLRSLYRSYEKIDPTKCIVIVSAVEGALDKFMEANADVVAASGHVIESTVLTTYLFKKPPKCKLSRARIGDLLGFIMGGRVG